MGESDYATLNRYADAGVVAIVFGQGASGTTCPCDSNGDGRVDDGGYFNEVASRYINGNRIQLAVTFSPTAQRSANGIVISWNDIGADSYEIWWGDTQSISAGADCHSDANCTVATGTAFSATLPDGVDSRFYLLVARQNGSITESSAVFEVVRLTQNIYLPVIRR